jgi:hypothetical protein
MVIDSYAEVYQ